MWIKHICDNNFSTSILNKEPQLDIRPILGTGEALIKKKLPHASFLGSHRKGLRYAKM